MYTNKKMNRIKKSYIQARKNMKAIDYDYKSMVPVSIFFLILSYFIQNLIGDVLLILGLFGSPLIIFIQGFWTFVIYIIKPN